MKKKHTGFQISHHIPNFPLSLGKGTAILLQAISNTLSSLKACHPCQLSNTDEGIPSLSTSTRLFGLKKFCTQRQS